MKITLPQENGPTLIIDMIQNEGGTSCIMEVTSETGVLFTEIIPPEGATELVKSDDAVLPPTNER